MTSFTLPEDKTNILLRPWSSALNNPERAEEYVAYIKEGYLDLSALVRTAPHAPWIEQTLRGLARIPPSHRHYQHDASQVAEGSDWEAACLTILNAWVQAGANPWRRMKNSEDDGVEADITQQSSPVHLVTLGWADLLATWLRRPDAPSPQELDEQRVLLEAVLGPNPRCIEVLLDHGCSPNILDPEGQPLLARAKTSSSAEMLIARGADLAQKTATGRSIMNFWRGRFTLNDLGHFQRLWQKHIGVPKDPSSRLELLRTGLPLGSKGRTVSALRSAGIKGDEINEEGHSLLDVVADQVWSKDASWHDKSVTVEVLRTVWEKGRHSLAHRPEGGLRFATALWSIAGDNAPQWLSAQVLQELGVDLGSPIALPVINAPAGCKSRQNRARGNLALWSLLDAQKNPRTWRDWVSDPVHASHRHALTVQALQGDIVPLRTGLLDLLAAQPSLIHDTAGDPWELVLTALLCVGLSYIGSPPHDKLYCPQGLRSYPPREKAATPAIQWARDLLNQARYPTEQTWTLYRPFLHRRLATKTPPSIQGFVFAAPFVRDLDAHVTRSVLHAAMDTPSRAPARRASRL